MWAAYVVLGKRVASAGSGVDDITVGFTLLVLGQLPHPLEAAGIVAVTGAVALSGSTDPGSH